jgi:SAM-dependent methyltransferase
MSSTIAESDPFAQFKAMQRETWAGFVANEGFTTIAAGELVAFADVEPADSVLDIGCGTGVIAITAAHVGARATGLDLTPVLLERARENAWIAGVEAEFTEGDVEALPYDDCSFDVVLSQFGHMFAPRPEVAVAEMLRVLKPRGLLAFTTWPPEHIMGQLFTLVGRAMPPSPPGVPAAPPPSLWGDPNIVRTRLGDAVSDLRFRRSAMLVPALSPEHVLNSIESSFGPIKTLLTRLDRSHPDLAVSVRADIIRLAEANIEKNVLVQPYLMSRATKNAAGT